MFETCSNQVSNLAEPVFFQSEQIWLEKSDKRPKISCTKHRAVFTLIDLADVRSAKSIRYGDAVWLQLSVGPGDASWEQGGVLGTKVREAPQLQALALRNDTSIRNDAQAPAVIGYPAPVRLSSESTRPLHATR
jgi:hypothetical protein